jgi:leader peptidase (prepilin peptidase)/N-methyltransferase
VPAALTAGALGAVPVDGGPAAVPAAVVCGLIIGSFANVVIYRLPRGESLVWPGSRCPACQAPIRWHDNLPLLSYLLLRGRCRACGAGIPRRYPLVEALSAAVFAQSVLAFGLGLRALESVVLATLLLIVFFIDLDHYIIPNKITYPGTVAGLVFTAALGGWRAAVAAALTGAALGAVFILINAVSARVLGEEGMGMGDAKLALMIGAFLGWPIGMVAILLGVFAGGAVGICLLALRLRGRREHIPFGPALAAGAMAALWWGPGLLHWYMSRLVG